MSKKKIIIFKNDAGGDLIHSREPIYNIIESNKDNEIILYLSERSEKFSFLFNAENLIIKRLNYHLTFFEKVVLFLYLIIYLMIAISVVVALAKELQPIRSKYKFIVLFDIKDT